MASSVEIWNSGDKEAIWEHFCGFLDMQLSEFMARQRQGLLEQIEVFANCQLGRAIMGEPAPSTVEEFRERVPLTTWSDYEAWMDEKRKDILPSKPVFWMCTSGAGGRTKWIPVCEETYRILADTGLFVFILGSAKRKGDFSLEKEDVVLYSTPPPPYASGYMTETLAGEYGLRLVPSAEEIRSLKTLQERSARGFQLGLVTGIDAMVALPSVLVRMGQQLADRMAAQEGPAHPEVARRLGKALESAKREGRPLLPKDLWQVKAMVVAGMDLAAFQDKVVYYWGVKPFEMYMNTEYFGPVATSTWTRRGLTFLPDMAFLEFIPEEESLASLTSPQMVPSTLLLDELRVGERYELVFTNFHRGPFIRYRPGDMIKVIALEDEEAEVNLPQITVEGRADKLIDLGGFTRLNERTIWQALEDVGLEYDGWMARKELEEGQPVLRLYLAPRQEYDPEELGEALHQSIKKFDSSYRDLEEMLGLQPLRLTLLPFGVFTRYTQERVAAGADPAHLKEQTMQPSETTVQRVLNLARDIAPGGIRE